MTWRSIASVFILACVGACQSLQDKAATFADMASEPESVAQAPMEGKAVFRGAPARPAASVSVTAGLSGKLELAGDEAGWGGGSKAGTTSPPGSGSAPRTQRMVHYNGFLKLRVTNPTETLQRASEMADRAGGYVESLTETTVTLRVPVKEFRAVFAELAKIGDVLSRSLTAQDVTDAFVSVELRIKTLKASHDRLMALFAVSRKARERMRLLREIRRLREEIDQLEMQRDTLASLAELSRVTVQTVGRELHVGTSAQEPIAAFRWIHTLSPFRRDLAMRGDVLELAVPKGMVELADTDFWIAESADGAVIWTSEQKNEPEGTTEFWLEAIRSRLGPEYGSTEVSTVGAFQVLRLVDQSEKAYRYLVGVRVSGSDLQLVEVYYPSEEHEERYGAAVKSVIERGEA